MKEGRIQNSGYIGLLALLISVAIIIFLIIRMDLYYKKGANGEPTQNTPAKLQAIDSAKQAKDMIEKNNQKTVEQIN